MVGHGILNATADRHRTHRRYLSPSAIWRRLGMSPALPVAGAQPSPGLHLHRTSMRYRRATRYPASSRHAAVPSAYTRAKRAVGPALLASPCTIAVTRLPGTRTHPTNGGCRRLRARGWFAHCLRAPAPDHNTRGTGLGGRSVGGVQPCRTSPLFWTGLDDRQISPDDHQSLNICSHDLLLISL